MLQSILHSFEYSANRPLLVREEKLKVFSEPDTFKILFLSDLHFTGGTPQKVSDEIIEAAILHKPHLILIGGDLADTRKGLVKLQDVLRKISCITTCAVVLGNHDFLIGKSYVKRLVEEAGAQWLAGEPLSFFHSKKIHVTADYNKLDAGSFNIYCNHYPSNFKKARRNKIPLMFAGHNHGGQFILGKYKEHFYPGAFLFPWNGARFKRENSTLIVSRGVQGIFPLRYNCPREVVLCSLY